MKALDLELLPRRRVPLAVWLMLLCGGMGTRPHLPLEPFWIDCTRLAAASLSLRYLSAMLRKAGPTTFSALAWHDRQPLACSKASPSLACAAAAARVKVEIKRRCRMVKNPDQENSG